MYEVVIVKADYEGWWLFDGWQEDIIQRHSFNDLAEMRDGYKKIVEKMKKDYNSHLKGKYELLAFFNGCELEYCDDCDEDLQIYYTPMKTKDNKFLKEC